MDKFDLFCTQITRIVSDDDEQEIPSRVRRELRRLITVDDWLRDPWAEERADRFQQHLLYRDCHGRFSVVSFVWGPRQHTPIHDHGVWGVVGVLRGAEWSQRYIIDDWNRPVIREPRSRLNVGDTELLLPEHGDIHQVANALDDSASISIHVYGADIGTCRRRIFEPEGRVVPFVSGYSDVSPMLTHISSLERRPQ